MSVEKLRTEISIWDVCQYLGIKLRRPAGQTQQVYCIMHDDGDRPAMRIYADTNKAFCHACEKGGDPIQITMWMRGWNYRQAVEHLAERYGIEVDPLAPTLQRFQRAAGRTNSLVLSDNQTYLDLLHKSYIRLRERNPAQTEQLHQTYQACLRQLTEGDAAGWYSRSLNELEACKKNPTPVERR